MATQGVFAGTECNNGSGFCPDDALDRQTMAVWVVRLLDGADPAPVSQTRFNDVDATGFYAPFIERMAELKVTTGCGDGSGFCPDRSVSRAQMAVFLSRAYSRADAPDPGFSDVPAGAWYGSAVAKLAGSGITQGCGDGTMFCPGDDTTRAQMATFLHRAENRPDPEQRHHPDFSQYEPGDVVHVAPLWPDEGYPADYVCQLLDNGEFVDEDGNSNCWRTSEADTFAVASGVAEPMERCASDTGWYGATRVSVYVGTTADGFYEPVVEGGEDSCERIKAWWDQINEAEAQRIEEGQYPCEHAAAYNYRRDENINGPAVLAGCWPRLMYAVGEEFRLDDPAEEAERLRHLEGSWVLPPNWPVFV
ncbi:MAG: S-layer homology domain-containing protein [Acidimicrobiaceae bacterium]|nr:S-layer homology domain-containing protein [Acidimicrobiaceae bacterium]